ncbi:uridine kinase [Actinopolymorpha singaporensis]|uniref:uridine kinase n=1 Tax=Actinopolymorpha singaporensis TaxID=117157 RepID=UPI001F5174CC|nr:uridine kinase [Actinopolymorpha singaporensis]
MPPSTPPLPPARPRPHSPAADVVTDVASGLAAEVAAQVLAAPPLLGPVRLVCVDGPACSGKTTLAARLAAALGDVPTVHMDDLYEGWDGLPTVAARLSTWLLEPLRGARPGRYRRYDWPRGEYAEWHEVPVGPALVVEGVGSASRVVEGLATSKLWVEAPQDVRRARAAARDAGAFEPYWDAWARAEQAHFAAEDTRRRADLRVDGVSGAYG